MNRERDRDYDDRRLPPISTAAFVEHLDTEGGSIPLEFERARTLHLLRRRTVEQEQHRTFGEIAAELPGVAPTPRSRRGRPTKGTVNIAVHVQEDGAHFSPKKNLAGVRKTETINNVRLRYNSCRDPTALEWLPDWRVYKVRARVFLILQNGARC